MQFFSAAQKFLSLFNPVHLSGGETPRAELCGNVLGPDGAGCNRGINRHCNIALEIRFKQQGVEEAEDSLAPHGLQDDSLF